MTDVAPLRHLACARRLRVSVPGVNRASIARPDLRAWSPVSMPTSVMVFDAWAIVLLTKSRTSMAEPGLHSRRCAIVLPVTQRFTAGPFRPLTHGIHRIPSRMAAGFLAFRSCWRVRA